MLEFRYPKGLLSGEPLNWFVLVDPSSLSVPAEPGAPHMAPDDARIRIVVWDAFEEGPVTLFYYADNLGYVGSSMCSSREEALENCVEEFADSLDSWTAIPDETDNVEEFVLRSVARDYSRADSLTHRAT